MAIVHIFGMAWYREADYESLKAMFIDGDRLPDTYERWKHIAEKNRANLISKGQTVLKVYIDAESFRTWCLANGRNLDSHGRMGFANARAIALYKESRLHGNGTRH